MLERTSLRGRARLLLAIAMLLMLPVLMAGCAKDAEDSDVAATATDTCVACHTDADALTEAGLPEEMEAKAYLVSQEFLDSDHAADGCVACHGGDDTADTKEAAHAEVVMDPSEDLSICGECHSGVTDTFDGSLHTTASGILEKLEIRMGGMENGAERAEELFYAEGSCYGCHGSCGQCHISVPTMFGGGLLEGHVITDASSQEVNDVTCAQCHDAIGPMYVERDLHHDMGFSCVDCHTNDAEFHGDGETHASIDEGTVTESCTDCHSGLSAGVHTPSHLAGATCDACHTTAYTSCTGCHEDDGLPDEVQDIIKLAKGEDGRITPVTHMGLSAEMFGEPYPEMDDLATKSTWILAAPHANQPAERTEELCNRCHGTGTALLQESDLQFPEIERSLLLGGPLSPVTP